MTQAEQVTVATRGCPSWCAGPTSLVDPGMACAKNHYGEAVEMELTLHEPWHGEEWVCRRPAWNATELSVNLVQGPDALNPYVVVFGDHGTARVQLTLDEAQRLSHVLSDLVSVATDDY
jgi:hypothetical protein